MSIEVLDAPAAFAGMSESKPTIDQQRRHELQQLSTQIVRLCLAGRGKSHAVKFLQNECRIMERAERDLPTMIREVVHSVR